MSHILIFPFPTSGHVIPILDLTQTLLNRGLTITIAITTQNLPLLNPLLSAYSSEQFHHLTLPSSPVQNENVSPGYKHPLVVRMYSMSTHYSFVLNWFKSHSSPPIAIISDFFLGWTYHLASELGLPRLVFSPSGAFGFSVFASIWLHQPQNDNPENNDFTVSFLDIPNSPSFPWWQIFHIYRMPKDSPDWKFFKDCFMANMASWGLIVNSFTELEKVYIEHIKEPFGNDRVWTVGPVLPELDGDDSIRNATNRGGISSVPCHDVLTWLDSRKDFSVVYVAFGSWTVLNSKQIDILVAGLEKSEANFILCTRQHGDYSRLLDELEARVAGRGLIIKGWAPQVTILRHRAVGAFVTHCGWNSVLEGISAGVVMLTWPMATDQFANAQLVVDELKVGIRVGEGTQRMPESSELAQILAKSVEGNLPERVKAKKMQEAALCAIKGGSSDADLNALVQRLKELKL